MPSDHILAVWDAISLDDLAGHAFIVMGNKAKVLRTVVDAYLDKAGVKITPAQNVDNPAMVMSLVAFTSGVTVIADDVQKRMPWSVISRPLSGDVPTIDRVVACRKTNQSPILKLFLSRIDEIISGTSTSRSG